MAEDHRHQPQWHLLHHQICRPVSQKAGRLGHYHVVGQRHPYLQQHWRDRIFLHQSGAGDDGVLAAQSPHLGSLASWKAIRAWFDSLIRLQVERDAHGGCPVGSLVGQLAETDEKARLQLQASFERWERHIREGLRSMQARGRLDRKADPDELATATLAAIQGGLLLTQTRRDPGQLAIALDAAYAHLRPHAAS